MYAVTMQIRVSLFLSTLENSTMQADVSLVNVSQITSF